jgi:hypothetical protein
MAIIFLLADIVYFILRGALKGLKRDESISLGKLTKLLEKTKSQKLIYLGALCTLLLVLNLIVIGAKSIPLHKWKPAF